MIAPRIDLVSLYLLLTPPAPPAGLAEGAGLEEGAGREGAGLALFDGRDWG